MNSVRRLLAEFVNRPREFHALFLGFALTYIGIFHKPFLNFVGVEVVLPVALGIGLVILGVRVDALRELFNERFLPERVNVPEDVRKEEFYYWGGVFAVFAAKHVAELAL